MGSIIDYIDCPKCGNEAYLEFNYKSGEEFITCKHCGYQREFYIENNPDEPQESVVDIELVNYQIKEFGGLGAFKMQRIGSVGFECGSFLEDYNSAEDFLRYVETNKDSIEYASYTYKEDDVWKEKVLIEKSELES